MIVGVSMQTRCTTYCPGASCVLAPVYYVVIRIYSHVMYMLVPSGGNETGVRHHTHHSILTEPSRKTPYELIYLDRGER